MNDSELYRELGTLTKDRSRWKESIPYVSSLLTHESVKIQTKALWLLGEMGLNYPLCVQDAVPVIASFLDSPAPLLRERGERPRQNRKGQLFCGRIVLDGFVPLCG